jgi:hypothetical protein
VSGANLRQDGCGTRRWCCSAFLRRSNLSRGGVHPLQGPCASWADLPAVSSESCAGRPADRHCSQMRTSQALPLTERSVGDLALRRLMQERQWARCPECTAVVERVSGCMHMQCRYVCLCTTTHARPHLRPQVRSSFLLRMRRKEGDWIGTVRSRHRLLAQPSCSSHITRWRYTHVCRL